MTKEEMIAKAVDILAEEFEVDKEEITPEADIKKTLDLDSLSLVDLVALIEENFDIKIKGSDLLQTATFSQLYDFLFQRISEK
ncbi:MAG: acyl carrier protein [Bacteroidales bacterium]|jgi:acyl carrier protein|nr:acyl carrier protein [Bacteroidales bacterium]MBQ1883091.1 acyl carrier protein [Bacteroidales bacterium]MBQ2482257.1 acyl carrier protein [Bacteroidales bacterium]MBQ2492545.1 acyl carrier protein [Bacteroidales bacterium]MBQ4197193.1 acyl carrier protein [Bacteroidales bacterium]